MVMIKLPLKPLKKRLIRTLKGTFLNDRGVRVPIEVYDRDRCLLSYVAQEAQMVPSGFAGTLQDSI